MSDSGTSFPLPGGAQPECTASTPGTAADNLIYTRELEFLETTYSNDVYADFSLPRSSFKLLKELNDEHETENDFSSKVFEVAKEMVGQPVLALGYEEVLSSATQLIFTSDVADIDQEFYFGLCREGCKVQTRASGDHIHAVVLFKKIIPAASESESSLPPRFEAARFLATVALKIQEEDKPAPFTVGKQSKSIYPPDLRKTHRFLGQELGYLLRSVWPSLCGCGIQEEEIPFAVIVGEATNVKEKGQLRSVLGALMMPEECCENIKYRIDGFVTFQDPPVPADIAVAAADLPVVAIKDVAAVDPIAVATCTVAAVDPFDATDSAVAAPVLSVGANSAEAAEDPSTSSALSAEYPSAAANSAGAAAYWKIITFGLRAAVCCANLSQHPIGLPMSGRKLIVAGEELHPNGPLRVLSTPASIVTSRTPIKVSQGDLFSGTLSIKVLSELCGKVQNGKGMWFSNPESGECEVIVKVSSRAVHRQTIGFKGTLAVLQKALDFGEPSLKISLADVLLAYYERSVGNITIMHDLRGNYHELRPEQLVSQNIPISSLWNSMATFVRTTLLPLAKQDAIHCDIRPGWDVTSNILVRRFADGALKLVLIDYESLVEFDSLPNHLNHDGRYVPSSLASSAIEHLWWQCLSLAYVWNHKIYQNMLIRMRTTPHILVDLICGLKRWAGTETEPTSDEFSRWVLCDSVMVELLQNQDDRDDADKFELMLERISTYFTQRKM